MTVDELLPMLVAKGVGYDADVDMAIAKIPDGLCCEFGVQAGRTLWQFADRLAPRIIYGFDSFEGLPEDWCGAAPKGSFKTDHTAQNWPPNSELIIGLFQDTLKPFLRTHDAPIAFAHMDADLYSSTKYVLNIVTDRLAPGAILIFDEIIGDKPCHDNEARAFAEWITETGLQFKVIGMRHRKSAIFQING